VAELIQIGYSPWSEKARWALDHHGFSYTRTEFTPLLSNLSVRVKLRRLRGRVTVPILIDGAAILRDSFDIAHHAEAHGRGKPLFPKAAVADIERWNRQSESGMRAGRALVVHRIARDPAAKRESLPAAIPGWLQPVMIPLARVGIRYLSNKYGIDDDGEADYEAELRQELHAVRDGLQGRSYLVGDFSFADIAAATMVQFIAPVNDQYIELNPVIRECWTRPALAEELGDLVAWRDDLYARHR
jgi:glutathione S-transferase